MSVDELQKVLGDLVDGKNPDDMQRFSDQFLDEVIFHEDLPNEYLDLLVSIVRSPTICAAPLATDLFANLMTEPPKVSEVQLRRMAHAVAGAYCDYTNEEFCLVICDLFARKLNPADTVEAFEKMSTSAHKVGVIAIAVGLETLLKNIEREGPVYARAFALYRELMA